MNESPGVYSQAELATIQRAIAPPPPPPPAELAGIMGTLPPEWMRPFWKLSDLEPDLFSRVSEDLWVVTLAQYAFFPRVLEWRAEGRDIPDLRITGRTRGPAAILRSGDEAIVIKPFQNTREDEIAAVAAGVDVGPAQLPSLPGYLTERFAEGMFFTELPPERRDPSTSSGRATLRAVGLALGGMLRRLHDAGVYYNDATLADPEGRSHLIIALRQAQDEREGAQDEREGVQDEREAARDEPLTCTLIDFGVSLLVSRHPDYTREEVHNFVRTLPMYRLVAGIADSRAEMDDFLAQYARQMAEATPEDIMARDLKFAQQGLSIAARRMGEGIIAPIRDGFVEGYRPVSKR